MEKTCSKCQIKKTTNCFHKAKNRKDGYHPYCKECRKTESSKRKKYRQQWYLRNRKHVLNKVKQRAEDKANEIKVYKKKYYFTNQEHEKARTKKHYYANHEKTKEIRRKQSKTEAQRQYRKEYYKKNAFRWTCRTFLRRTLSWLQKEKNERTHVALGYSAGILKEHIESLWTEGMSWYNYGEWHIDHVKPICSFPKTAEPKEINALSNLQPLWATTRTINGRVYQGNINKWKN